MTTDANNENANLAQAPSSSGRPRRIITRCAVILWLGCAAAGLGYLANYAAKPGAPSTTPTKWPSTTSIPHDPESATLILFLHPHCPCSSATLGELERALAWRTIPLQLSVVFCHPEGVDDAWSQTPLRRRVESLKPSFVVDDETGDEARLFGAATSGHAVLFDHTGSLVFQGGLTGSRGHEGDNPGRASLEALLAGRSALVRSTPVFGCPLSGDTECSNTTITCCEPQS